MISVEQLCERAPIMAITAVSANSLSAWRQVQLQQAQRNVDLAERSARALQAQANDAQAVADQAQENANSLKTEANQAQSVSNRANLWLQTEKTLSQTGTQLNNVIAQNLQKAVSSVSVPVQPQTPAVVNTQGQTIGTVVNTTA
jgi:uncharacterized membrane protein YccC